MEHFSKLISVVIPTLNSESSIRIAIGSILRQSLENWEVLIVDGGSIDKTVYLLEQFNDHRIKIFDFPGTSVYDAMNKGIHLAQGKWLYFMGSDDQLFDDRIFNDISSLLADQSSYFIYGNASISGSVPWAKGEENYGGKFNLYRLLRRNICHQAIFYNRSFLQKNNLGYKTEFPISADWDLNIRCFLLTKPTFVNRTIGIFQGGGKSSRESDSFSESIKTIYHRYWTNPYQSQPKRFLYSLFSKLKSGLRGS